MIYAQPDVALGEILKSAFESGTWTEAYIAVAWVRRSGVVQLAPSIKTFLENSGSIKLVSGIDLENTSREGLDSLIFLSTFGQIETFVYFNEAASIFHPKLYLFANSTQAQLIIGSNNMTSSGLYSNVEAALSVRIERPSDDFDRVLKTFVNWTDTSSGLCKQLDASTLNDLAANGYVKSEFEIRQAVAGKRAKFAGSKRMFGYLAPAHAPAVSNILPVITGTSVAPVPPSAAPISLPASGATSITPVPPSPAGGPQGTAAAPTGPLAPHVAPVVPATPPPAPSGPTNLAATAIAATANTHAFWIETGALTGGSRNQLDLSMMTKDNRIPGSISLFGINGASTKAITNLTIRFRGVDYSNNSIKYPSTAQGKTNGTWRLQLNGTDSAGRKLTTYCPQFVNQILLFVPVGKNHYEITHVLPRSTVATLVGQSKVADRNRGLGGRQFGKL